MTHTEQIETLKDSDEEFDLLDILVVLVENLKLLLIIPVLAALLGAGIAYVWPPTFASTSVYAPTQRYVSITPEVLASYLRAPDVLLAAAHAVDVAPELSDEKLLKKMAQLVEANVGRADKLLTVTTYGKTPEAAQKLNQAVWEYALAKTAPRGLEAQQLQQQLQVEKQRLTSSMAMEKNVEEALRQGALNEKNVLLYGELLKANSQRLEAINALEAQLGGMSLTNFTHAASLPEEPIKPKKLMIVMAATLAGGFFALFLVCLRVVWKNASTNPEQQSKVQRIRKALGCQA